MIIYNNITSLGRSHTVSRHALRDGSSLDRIPLNRVCGVDETGTLYIGRSQESLLNRLASLIATHHHGFTAAPHRKLCKGLAALFPDDKLAFSWEATDDPKLRESKLLWAYEDVFGELPPINSQKPKK
jgi:hypothetical protein